MVARTSLVAVAFQPAARTVEGELQPRGAEHRTLPGELQVVRLPPVVEPRRALQHQPHLAAHAADRADQPVPVARPLGLVDRHEVDHLADTVGGHETGDQVGGLGEVQLPGDAVPALGSDPEVAAPLLVQQRREHAGRVEARAAEPVDRAAGGHQRRGL
jgi:hypothetical protein